MNPANIIKVLDALAQWYEGKIPLVEVMKTSADVNQDMAKIFIDNGLLAEGWKPKQAIPLQTYINVLILAIYLRLVKLIKK